MSNPKPKAGQGLLDDLEGTSIGNARRIELADIADRLEPLFNAITPGAENPIASVKALGLVVQANRTDLRLSQQELADMAGVGRRFVSELENGKETLEIGRVLTVCQALGIDILARKR